MSARTYFARLWLRTVEGDVRNPLGFFFRDKTRFFETGLFLNGVKKLFFFVMRPSELGLPLDQML